jgi:hypothetical protein
MKISKLIKTLDYITCNYCGFKFYAQHGHSTSICYRRYKRKKFDLFVIFALTLAGCVFIIVSLS